MSAPSTDQHSHKPENPGVILVTGATGFIGRPVLRTLQRSAYRLRVCSRRRSRPAWLEEGIEFASLNDSQLENRWASLFDRVDAVIHLAASNPSGKQDAAELFAVNGELTQNLAEQAVRHDVRRFLLLSSIKVHGEQSIERPFKHDDTPAPKDDYARSKLEAERRLLAATEGSRTQAVIIRPSLVYGPGVGGNLSRLIRQVAKRAPLPLGRVHNRRQLTALDSLCQLILLCLEHPAAAGQVFLAADASSISTAELIRQLALGLGKRPRLWPLPTSLLRLAAALSGRGEEMRRLLGNLEVDLNHTVATLGWSPQSDTASAIRQMASAVNDRPD